MASNANNGLITKIWGPPAWEFLHSITFGYPINPTPEQKEAYKDFFIRVGDILPCKYCRESYKKFISKGNTKLTDKVLENRESLTNWFYLIHEQVNQKLGVSYGVTYEDICDKYESYRAKCSKKKVKKEKGCITPLDEKAESYKNAYNKNCPLIPFNISKQFKYYAKLRGLGKEEFYYLEKIKDKEDLTKLMDDKCCSMWCKRNKECNEIIKDMRLFGKDSLEKEGRWEGLPTIDELKLILRFSSNLTSEVLTNLVLKLPSRNPGIKKIYRLVR